MSISPLRRFHAPTTEAHRASLKEGSNHLDPAPKCILSSGVSFNSSAQNLHFFGLPILAVTKRRRAEEWSRGLGRIPAETLGCDQHLRLAKFIARRSARGRMAGSAHSSVWLALNRTDGSRGIPSDGRLKRNVSDHASESVGGRKQSARSAILGASCT